MAKKLSMEVERKAVSTSLVQLYLALTESAQGVVLNPETLTSAAQAVNRPSKDQCFSYDVSCLRLRVPVPQKTIPSACTGELTIEVDLSIKVDLSLNAAESVTELVLSLFITSESGNNICAWHFDRHIEGGNQTEAHPLFHFQHGGHALSLHSGLLGNSLVIPAPRLAFPPMDAILAIDFVLSNFAGDCWRNLRNNPVYLRLLEEAQRAFWTPYFTTLASWWDRGPPGPSDKKILALLPQLA